MTTNQKIKEVRLAANMTQAQVAAMIHVNVATYSGYESGKFFPRPRTLLAIADAVGAPVAELMGDDLAALADAYAAAKPAPAPAASEAGSIFDPGRMYTYIKGYASALDWTDALRALTFARSAHDGQKRKGGQPYLIHPLTVAAHALALGLKDQAIVTACLYHDVPEDCGVAWEDLPIEDPEAKDAVRRLTHVKSVPLDVYYDEVAGNPVSAIAKLLDRCDNVSTMAGVFRPAKLLDYCRETRVHVMPLYRVAKDRWPEYSSALFVLKYHILSVVGGLEKCTPDGQPPE